VPDGPERLFLFIQFEFPWELGPPDGRYLLRSQPGGEPERVVVLGTVGAARRQRQPLLARPNSRRVRPTATPEPAPVATARATIVDPVSLSAERQARAWMAELDAERDTQSAVTVLNRVLHSHRVAAADPYTHEVSPVQALVIRAGWGEGEQVADGQWLHARELPWRTSRKQRRVAALRPQERLAHILGARGAILMCEEHALRARLDLDHGRLAHATAELQAAYAAALPELRGEHRQDLTIRIAELEQLRAGVTAQARAALPGSAKRPDEETVRHALERLEAALRARTATGFHP
jgi:hypothetical protein